MVGVTVGVRVTLDVQIMYSLHFAGNAIDVM